MILIADTSIPFLKVQIFTNIKVGSCMPIIYLKNTVYAKANYLYYNLKYMNSNYTWIRTLNKWPPRLFILALPSWNKTHAQAQQYFSIRFILPGLLWQWLIARFGFWNWELADMLKTLVLFRSSLVFHLKRVIVI